MRWDFFYFSFLFYFKILTFQFAYIFLFVEGCVILYGERRKVMKMNNVKRKRKSKKMHQRSWGEKKKSIQ